MGVEVFEPPKMVTVQLEIRGSAYPVRIQYNMDTFWDFPDSLVDALDTVIREAKIRLSELSA